MTTRAKKRLIKKLLISLGLSLLGAFATWMMTLPTSIDWGVYAPLIGAMCPLIASAIREYIKLQA